MGKFVTFDEEGYKSALRNALLLAMDKINSKVYSELITGFGNIDLRRMDKPYRDAMLKSIRVATDATMYRIVNYYRAGDLTRPNESFRVIYYEYGTGTLAEYPAGYSTTKDPHWNPARPKGKYPHWQRPRGIWQDMGGNFHKSKTRGKPQMLSEKSRKGEQIEPTWWFKKAFDEGTIGFDDKILESVKSVPISSYIRLRSIYKRM